MEAVNVTGVSPAAGMRTGLLSGAMAFNVGTTGAGRWAGAGAGIRTGAAEGSVVRGKGAGSVATAGLSSAPPRCVSRNCGRFARAPAHAGSEIRGRPLPLAVSLFNRFGFPVGGSVGVGSGAGCSAAISNMAAGSRRSIRRTGAGGSAGGRGVATAFAAGNNSLKIRPATGGISNLSRTGISSDSQRHCMGTKLEVQRGAPSLGWIRVLKSASRTERSPATSA